MSLTDPERLAWLRLARTPRVGPVTFAGLIARFGSARDALAALPTLTFDPPRPPTPDAVRREAERIDKAGGTVVLACDDAFPDRLAALSPPPPVLTVLGDVALLARPGVGMVGARNASAAGRRFAEQLARDIGQAGYVVVSGLAAGIDGAAHAGALETGTVAVVAGGADHVYPAQHADLHAAIAREGAIVSERPWGASPKAQDFPRRNRLISGLSLGVIVTEAARRSGSLITARYAGEQGRELMAVPGFPLDPRSEGANGLIRDGATLIRNGEDVIEALTALTGEARRPAPARDGAPAWFTPSAARPDAALTDRLRELLSHTPTPLADLARMADADPPALLAALVDLELSGEADLAADGTAAARFDGG